MADSLSLAMLVLLESLSPEQRAPPGLPRSGHIVAPVEVNGGPGAFFLDAQQQVIGAWALDITDGQITSIRSIVNRDKLMHLGPVADLKSILRSVSGK